MARMDFKNEIELFLQKRFVIIFNFESQAYKKVMLMLLTLKYVCYF